MAYALPYLILINAVSLLLMRQDKLNAVRRKARVPETVLIGAAMIGGSLGAVIGMFAFHHKTRKPMFSIGLPLILFIQIGAVLLFF